MARNNRFPTKYLEEAESRIKEMEDPNYVFPEAFSKADWYLAIGIIVLTGALIIAGYWL